MDETNSPSASNPNAVAAREHSQHYRPDIDGLRAIAVVSVLLFHAKFTMFSGGFVGVDVFFVISGFLITSIIIKDIESQRFTIAGFYERRIRRILPALFSLLLVSFGIAWTLMLPDDLRSFGVAAFAAILSLSNIAFLRQQGYFRPEAENQPLLHTWSLGVEEQFYLVFPLMLAALYAGRRRAVGPAILAILLVSLAASILFTNHRPVAAFYLTPTRAWELMIGSALALDLVPTLRNSAVRNFAAVAGLLLIGYAIFTFDSTTVFPGLAALAPCLGTALIIHAAPGTAIADLLSRKPFVRTGLISYSFYLWHWPILVFAQYYLIRELTTAEVMAALAASFAAGYLSWRYVERPFRNRDFLRGRKIFVATGISAFLGAVVSLALVVWNGFPSRVTTKVNRLAAAKFAYTADRDDCIFADAKEILAGRSCRIGLPAARPTMAIWGDSHADALAPAIDLIARDRGAAALRLTRASCPPLLGVDILEDGLSRDCVDWADAALSEIRRTNVGTVVLHGRWAAYFQGADYVIDEAKKFRMVSGDSEPLAKGLERTLKALEGRRVVLVLSTPEFRMNVPDTLARQALTGRRADLEVSIADHEARQQTVRSTLVRLAERHGATIFDPSSVLCRQRCRSEWSGQPAYYDNHHLSITGARALAPTLAESIERSALPAARKAR